MTFNKSKSRLSLFLSIFALLVPVMATAQNASDVQVSLVGVHTQTQAKSKTNQASLILKKELRQKLQHAGLRIKANFSVQLSPSTEQDDTAKTTRFRKQSSKPMRFIRKAIWSMPFLFISRRSNFLRPLIARHKNKSKHSATYVCKPQTNYSSQKISPTKRHLCCAPP